MRIHYINHINHINYINYINYIILLTNPYQKSIKNYGNKNSKRNQRR